MKQYTEDLASHNHLRIVCIYSAFDFVSHMKVSCRRVEMWTQHKTLWGRHDVSVRFRVRTARCSSAFKTVWGVGTSLTPGCKLAGETLHRTFNTVRLLSYSRNKFLSVCTQSRFFLTALRDLLYCKQLWYKHKPSQPKKKVFFLIFKQCLMYINSPLERWFYWFGVHQ